MTGRADIARSSRLFELYMGKHFHLKEFTIVTDDFMRIIVNDDFSNANSTWLWGVLRTSHKMAGWAYSDRLSNASVFIGAIGH